MRPDRTRCHAGSTGYTLVELALVIAILGVLAGFAAPRFFDDRTFDERGYADALAGGLRAARAAAVATGCPVRFAVDAAGWRARLQAAAAGTCDPADATWPVPVPLADGTRLEGAAAATVVPADARVVFDAAGVPDAAPTLGVGPWRVTIDAQTGHVAVLRP